MDRRERWVRPPLTLTRRTVLKGGIGAVVATTATRAGLRSGAAQEGPALPGELPRFDGVTLRIFTQTGPFISGPAKAHAPQFEQLTGAKVEVIEAPFAELFPKAQQVAVTGSGDFDILLVSNTWVADFVNLNYVIPFDDFIQQDLEDAILAWDDIPDGIKAKDSWGGKTYAFIVDNDNHSMFYRKDVLSDPQWQEAYRNETGEDLPNPPQTLTEFVKVAQFFTGKDWDSSVSADKYGFVTSVTRGAQSFWYCYPWAAQYAVVPADKAPAQGIFLFDPDMNPLVNTEGFVRGITEYVEAIKTAHKPGLDTVRGDVISEVVSGRALMAFDWGDIGPASVGPDSVVKGKIGFAMVPGATEYFDWQTGTWVTMPEGEIHRVPTHAFNGWSYYITAQSQNPEAAWAWIKFHASAPISAIDVASPDSGYQPWRTSHSENLQAWVEVGWSEEDARSYVQTILDVTNHPNAVFDPRIPGAARYQEALELHLLRAVAEEASPQQAMDDCATDFNSITDELGRDNQIAAYKAHLGIS
ncbi:MAG TPA: extracellular solute-binding protein [Thermomicrobiales bacterium]|mgnify:CR=1 FL=1